MRAAFSETSEAGEALTQLFSLYVSYRGSDDTVTLMSHAIDAVEQRVTVDDEAQPLGQSCSVTDAELEYDC